jgi:hypothetical protein
MILTYNLIQTKNRTSVITQSYPINASLCGIQQQGQLPDTVTLSYDELAAILQDGKIGLNILRCLYRPTAETVKIGAFNSITKDGYPYE